MKPAYYAAAFVLCFLRAPLKPIVALYCILSVLADKMVRKGLEA
jgi:hypothetical protein